MYHENGPNPQKFSCGVQSFAPGSPAQAGYKGKMPYLIPVTTITIQGFTHDFSLLFGGLGNHFTIYVHTRFSKTFSLEIPFTKKPSSQFPLVYVESSGQQIQGKFKFKVPF